MTTITTPATAPTLPALWATTKGLVVGDYVAKALSGRPKLGPAEWHQVERIEDSGAMKTIHLADGAAWQFGNATKVFIAKAEVAAAVLPVEVSPEVAATVAAVFGDDEPAGPPWCQICERRDHTEDACPDRAAHDAQVAAEAPPEVEAAYEAAMAEMAAAAPQVEAAAQAATTTRRARKASSTTRAAARDARKAEREAAKAAKAEAKASSPSRGRQARTAPKAIVASAGFTGEQAARVGAAAGDGLTGYVVRWPHAGYDLLKLVDGEGSPWLVRCNAHGTTAPVANAKEGDQQGRREALATWCAGHAAAS